MSYLGFDYFSNEIVTEIRKSSLVGTVYDYAATQLDKYPAVVVTAGALSSKFADTARNSDTFTFNILVLASRLGIEENVEGIMRALVDDIITRLSNNVTINDNLNTFGHPLSIQWGYASSPDPDMRIASINYEIEVAQ